MELDTAFGLIAGVLVVSALAAGLVERAPLSFPMLFLSLGLLIGDRGLGFVSIGLDTSVLQVVAVVALALVPFLDAINLELTELRRGWLAPLLVLGPATLLVIGLLAGAGMLLLDLPVVLASLLGTILASTDPVVLRDVLRDPRIPRSDPGSWIGSTGASRSGASTSRYPVESITDAAAYRPSIATSATSNCQGV